MSKATSDYAAYLTKVSNDINTYLTYILPAIGIPCNLISVFIFWRLIRNKSNMVFLGIFQSIFDAILLLLVLLVFRSKYLFGINLVNQGDALCKVVTFLRRYIYIASSWMLVLITFDRVIFVLYRYEGRFKFMKNKLILTALIFALLVILALFNVPNFLFYSDAKLACVSPENIDLVTDIVSIIFRTFLPFALMIVSNLAMILKISKSSRNMFKNTTSSRRELQLTFAVMAFNGFFLFVNIPFALYFIFSDVNSYSGAMDNNPLFKAQYALCNAVTSSFSFFQQTFSFFMYLIFNKLFRAEFFSLIGLKKFSISPSTNASTKQHTIHNNITAF